MCDENAKKIILFLEENGFVESGFSFHKSVEDGVDISLSNLQENEALFHVFKSDSISAKFLFKYSKELFLALCDSYKKLIFNPNIRHNFNTYFAYYTYGEFCYSGNGIHKIEYVNGELVFSSKY